MIEDYSRSTVLLVADALRFTKRITTKRRDIMADILTDVVRGPITLEQSRQHLKTMLEAGCSITAPFVWDRWLDNFIKEEDG